MNHFQLFAHGESFDPDTFLATTAVQFDGTWHKGERHPQSSGVKKVLGNGQTLSLHEQERIAIEFLTDNRKALKALAQYPGVTTFILGLQYHIELEEDTVCFSMGPSARLMWQALDIGIEPTFYVTLDRRREWETDL